MSEHPIEGLMITAMNSIKDMIDVNTIIGEPIHAFNNTVIIPISKVCFGFAAGGSEFRGETINEYSKKEKEEEIQYRLPFGGGSGAGVNVNPVAFLVIQSNNVKLLPVNHASSVDKLLDYIPDLIEKANSLLNKNMQNKKEERKEEKNKVKRQEEKNSNIPNNIEFENNNIPKPKIKKVVTPEVEKITPPITQPNVEDYEVEYVEQEPGDIEYEEFDKYDD